MNNSTPSSIVSKPKTFMILSLNVELEALKHEINMNEAYLSRIDLILIQEPFIFHERSRRNTKHHLAYASFLLNTDWNTSRPRVVSYIRKRLAIHAVQINTSSNDLLIFFLNSPSGRILNIFNIFNAPYNQICITYIQTFYTLPQSFFQGSYLLQGDFNLHHTRWQSSCFHSPILGSESFVEWADDNYFCLLSPLEKKTNNRGNFLDLGLGSGPLLCPSKCCIVTHLDVTLDHLLLLTIIGWRNALKIHQRLRPDWLDSTLFQN